jgi:5-formyltetrahydrofolate cyclo-ligase
MSIVVQKSELRKQIKQILAGISPEIKAEKSRKICQTIICSREYQQAKVLMLFLSMASEVDTASIILDAFRSGKTVAVPKVFPSERMMIAVEIRSLETGFQVGKLGVREPAIGNQVLGEEIELVIVPGLAFDRQGNRLGRGAAYYDRFLADPQMHSLKWAVAFSEQIVDAVPHHEKDVPMDALVCEQGILKFKQ